MNFILDFEKMLEHRAKHISGEKHYKNKAVPNSNISVFCTHQHVSKHDLDDILSQLFK